MKKNAVFIVGMVLIGFCHIARGQYFNSDYDVPYVPTKYPVVECMLEMANDMGEWEPDRYGNSGVRRTILESETRPIDRRPSGCAGFEVN